MGDLVPVRRGAGAGAVARTVDFALLNRSRLRCVVRLWLVASACTLVGRSALAAPELPPVLSPADAAADAVIEDEDEDVEEERAADPLGVRVVATPPRPPESFRAEPVLTPHVHAGDGAAPLHEAGVAVRLHDEEVFVMRVAAGEQSAAARAQAAAQILARMADAPDAPEVTVNVSQGVAVIYGGRAPIVQLFPADARAAGDASLDVHAAAVAARIGDSLTAERRRRALAAAVFSFSMLVFSALLAVLLVRKGTMLIQRGRAWVKAHPERIPALRVLSVDLVNGAALRGGLAVALWVGKVLLQVGIAYTWLLFALSLFEATRDYGARLTTFVLAPLSALVGRTGSAIPVLLLALVALTVVVIAVRFVGLIFSSLARGDASLDVIPQDLAAPAGVLAQGALIVAALLAASPLLAGSDGGSFSRVGVAALLALALGAAPVLASVAVGITTVFGRRLSRGDAVEFRGRRGVITQVGLIDVKIRDELGGLLRVPHLTLLLAPIRLRGHAHARVLDVVVAGDAAQTHVRAVLRAAAARFGTTVLVELHRLDGEGAHYRISADGIRSAAGPDEDLATAVADALVAAGVHRGERRSHARDVP